MVVCDLLITRLVCYSDCSVVEDVPHLDLFNPVSLLCCVMGAVNLKLTFVTVTPVLTPGQKPSALKQPRHRLTVASANTENENNANDASPAKGVNLFVSDLRQIGTKLNIKQRETDTQPKRIRSEFGKNVISLVAQTQGYIERGIERDSVAREKLARNLYVPGSAISRIIRQLRPVSEEWRPLQYFEWQRVTGELSPSAARTVQRTQRDSMIDSVKKTTTNVIRASLAVGGKAILALMDVTVKGMKRNGSRRKRRKQRQQQQRTVQNMVVNSGMRRMRREWSLSGYETRLFFVVAGAIGAKAAIIAATPFAAVASTVAVVSEASKPRGIPNSLLDQVVERRSKVLKKVNEFLVNRRNVRMLLPSGTSSVEDDIDVKTTTTAKKRSAMEKKGGVLKTRGGSIRKQSQAEIEDVTIVEAQVKQVGEVAPAVLYTPVAGTVLQGVDTVAYFVENGTERWLRRIQVTFGIERKTVNDEWSILSVFRWQREDT